MRRANGLRYKEYLGMAKMERRIIRELMEDPTRRRAAPPPSPEEVSYEVRGITIEKLLAASRELKEWQGKLVRAKAALIGAAKEAEKGAWEAGSELKEEALRKWLCKKLSRVDKLEEGLDRKGREMAKWA